MASNKNMSSSTNKEEDLTLNKKENGSSSPDDRDDVVVAATSNNEDVPTSIPNQITAFNVEKDEEETTYSIENGDFDGPDVDGDVPSSSASRGMTKLVMVAAATAATLGYDVGIMAAAIQPLEDEMNLSSFQKELAMGSLNFVAAAGAIWGGNVANVKGRKPTVQLCCWLFVVGTLCMSLAPHYSILLLGRIITGLGVGVSFVVAPVYLSEISPTHLRGQLNTVFDVAINGGILLGYVIGFLVEVSPIIHKWRVMLGLGLILPIIVLLYLSSLPESPRWLVMANQSAAAIAVLESLGNNKRHVLKTVSSIEDELETERQEESSGHGAPSLYRWSPGMKLAIGLGFWQQITGTEAVLYYSADFLKSAGLESPTERLLGNVFVGLCKLTPELLAMRLVDTIGRRPLIIASAISLMFSTILLSIAFYLSWHPLTVVLLLCLVMASFSIGLGPFTFLVASECLGLSERATGMTLCAAINRCTSGTVALTAVSLYDALGSAGFFTLYSIVGFTSLPFYYTAVPETSGQTLEQLAARNRVNNNKTTMTHNEGSENMELKDSNNTNENHNEDVEVRGELT